MHFTSKLVVSAFGVAILISAAVDFGQTGSIVTVSSSPATSQPSQPSKKTLVAARKAEAANKLAQLKAVDPNTLDPIALAAHEAAIYEAGLLGRPSHRNWQQHRAWLTCALGKVDANAPGAKKLLAHQAHIDLDFGDANAGLATVYKLVGTDAQASAEGVFREAASKAPDANVAALVSMVGGQTALVVAKRRTDLSAATRAALATLAGSPTDAMVIVASGLPANDVANLANATAQSVLDRYKLWIRAQTGLIESRMIQTAANQLLQGGTARPFTITAAANYWAALEANSPYAGVLVPLLNGQYATAAQFAFDRAKVSDDDTDYSNWVQAVAACIRCNDQCYNGRAVNFVKWVRGDIPTNPAPDMVDPNR